MSALTILAAAALMINFGIGIADHNWTAAMGWAAAVGFFAAYHTKRR